MRIYSRKQIAVLCAVLSLLGLCVLAVLMLGSISIFPLQMLGLLFSFVGPAGFLFLLLFPGKQSPSHSDSPLSAEPNERLEDLLPGLLRDGVLNNSEFAKLLESLDVRLDLPSYRVALLPDSEKILGGDFDKQIKRLGEFVQAALPLLHVYTMYYNDSVVFLLGAERLDTDESALETSFYTFIDNIKAAYRFEPQIYLGCLVYSPNDIPVSYRSALGIYERSFTAEADPGIVMLDTRSLAGETNMTFLDELHMMLGHLIESEFVTASQILRRVFEAYSHDAKPYRTVVDERLDFFRSTFIQAVEAAITNNEAAINAYLLSRKRLDNFESIPSTEEIHQIYLAIATVAEEAVKMRRQAAIGPALQTKQFIDAHYGDPMLDNTMLSEQLGFSVSYLTRLFKQAYGQTILNYITSQRLKAAESLLKETDLTIEEIAVTVGYNSASTFTRSFQKKYSASPNQYRKTCKRLDRYQSD